MRKIRITGSILGFTRRIVGAVVNDVISGVKDEVYVPAAKVVGQVKTKATREEDKQA